MSPLILLGFKVVGQRVKGNKQNCSRVDILNWVKGVAEELG
jgi:hypothetical protein